MEAVGFAPWGGNLYCLTAAGQLLAMKGSGKREGVQVAGDGIQHTQSSVSGAG